MGACARFAHVEDRAPRDDFATVADECVEDFAQRKRARLAVDERDHVDAERDLQLRLLEQIVEQHVARSVAAHFDHDAQAVLVRFVPQTVGLDAFELLFLDQLGDLLDQPRLVDLIRDLRDDDRLAAVVVGLDLGFGANEDAAAAGLVGFDDAGRAVDDARGRKIRAGHEMHQLIETELRIVDERDARRNDFAQIVRRHVRRHADRDAGRAIDEEIRQARRQHRRFLFLLIVVRDEIDRFLVEIGEQFGRQAFQTAFGVAHRRGVVAIDRSEVALSIDERITQREILRHAHQRVVDRGIAVRMVFTHHLADDARAFDVRAIPDVVGFLHAEQHAAVHRFQSVPNVGQRTSDDHAHCVVEITLPDFVLDIDANDFSGQLSHQPFLPEKPLVSGRVPGRRLLDIGLFFDRS